VQRHRVTALPPAAASMLLGVVAGIVVRATGLAAPLRFSPAAFFYGLLPPIVFAAGFTLKKRDFFR
jgi:solute carrier family 9 (sodium/hydrogen exchanger), member 8